MDLEALGLILCGFGHLRQERSLRANAVVSGEVDSPPKFSGLAFSFLMLRLGPMAIFTGLVIAIVFLLVGAAAFRYLVRG